MILESFIDILYELIVVETDLGLIINTYQNENEILVNLNDGSTFLIKVIKNKKED